MARDASDVIGPDKMLSLAEREIASVRCLLYDSKSALVQRFAHLRHYAPKWPPEPGDLALFEALRRRVGVRGWLAVATARVWACIMREESACVLAGQRPAVLCFTEGQQTRRRR